MRTGRRSFATSRRPSGWLTSSRPPSETSRANEVVNYLTRYLTGGPISDHRITAADDRHVTFLARQGDKTGGEPQQVPVTLKLDDFVRRWCLHIQPDQLTKTRYLGGWSGQHRVTYMARCRELLHLACSEMR